MYTICMKGVCVVKKISKFMAQFARKAAIIACGQASQWGIYQPQEPKFCKK